MINATKDLQYSVAAKKTYQVLATATQRISLDSDYGLDTTDNTTLADSYEKVLKINSRSTIGSYLPDVSYLRYNSSTIHTTLNSSNTSPLFAMTDGSYIIPFIDWATCSQSTNTSAPSNACGEFFVDTNGKKGPNMFGKDGIYFWLIKKNGIFLVIPEGSETNFGATNNRECLNPGTASAPGQGCTYYYINNITLP